MSTPIVSLVQSPLIGHGLSQMVGHLYRDGREATYEGLVSAFFAEMGNTIQKYDNDHCGYTFAQIKDDAISALNLFNKYTLGIAGESDLETASRLIKKARNKFIEKSNFYSRSDYTDESILRVCLYSIEPLAAAELLILSKKFERMQVLIKEINEAISQYNLRADRLILNYEKVEEPQIETKHWKELKGVWNGVRYRLEYTELTRITGNPYASYLLPAIVEMLSDKQEIAALRQKTSSELMLELTASTIRSNHFELFRLFIGTMEINEEILAALYKLCEATNAKVYPQELDAIKSHLDYLNRGNGHSLLFNETPFHKSVREGFVSIKEYFRHSYHAAQAENASLNTLGLTPIDLAKAIGRPDVALYVEFCAACAGGVRCLTKLQSLLYCYPPNNQDARAFREICMFSGNYVGAFLFDPFIDTKPEIKDLFRAIDSQSITTLEKLLNLDKTLLYAKEPSTQDSPVEFAKRLDNQKIVKYFESFATKLAIEALLSQNYKSFIEHINIGASIDFCDPRTGNTLLHYIAQMTTEGELGDGGFTKYGELYQRYKEADLVNKKNNEGKTALEIAKERFGDIFSEKFPMLEKYYTPPVKDIEQVVKHWRWNFLETFFK